MKINRDNYEAYFLDYFEGQLSLEVVEEVLIFVKQNPDLKNVLDEFEAVSLVADQDIVFEKKSSLKKNQVFATSQINELNYEEYLLGETEGLLNTEQLASLEEFISINPQFEKDRRLFSLAHFPDENDVVFEAKESLKQKAIPVGVINADTFETYLARELEGDLNQEEKLHLAEFIQFNPHLERDRNLYKHTILEADAGIIFEEKESLKQAAIVQIRRIVYYALSAAASLALIFSVYFLLDRNDIPRSIANQGKANNTINRTVSVPASGNTNNPVAAIKQSATSVSTPLHDHSITNTSATDYDASLQPASVASIERSTLESLQTRSASEITTRSYVDPQFTFIRTSQMYINQNREFYYNLKLAEQIQYARLNSEDKHPAKTIFDATLGKAGGLFASNHTTLPKEEKQSITFWTFAELGVHTFNTITSSELELKLNKDDEGKVVSYNFESGLIDLEREVKK